MNDPHGMRKRRGRRTRAVMTGIRAALDQIESNVTQTHELAVDLLLSIEDDLKDLNRHTMTGIHVVSSPKYRQLVGSVQKKLLDIFTLLCNIN